MSLKDVKEDGSESDSDDTIHLTGSMVESSKKKKLKKFDFVTEGGDHVHLTEEKIKEQKRIKESAKAEATKHEVEVRREELVDLLGHDVVSKSTKKFKTSVQYEDHPTGTVLNELVLGMILFNSFHRQDFVIIEDFRDCPNEMLYTVQDIFFRLHQGTRLDDHARTFSSLLLAEVDKRNLNPLKQIRAIEQLRQ
ncbi:hypothetical protein Tco_0520529 [Tanacetum coccineum]